MKSIVEDFKADTAVIKRMLSDIELGRNNSDSMLLLLTGDDISDDEAMKNAGNMRLIRNQKTNDGIIRYRGQIEVIIGYQNG